jgi:hypothetical protein
MTSQGLLLEYLNFLGRQLQLLCKLPDIYEVDKEKADSPGLGSNSLSLEAFGSRQIAERPREEG